MPKYLFRSNYTPDGVPGLLREGGSSRRDAARRAAESVGGTLEGFYYAFGDTDVFIIMDLPDNVSAAALKLATAATGTISGDTVVLLTPEEVDEATGRETEYRAPGATAP
jgi:uncharacterized protein with GYD domain